MFNDKTLQEITVDDLIKYRTTRGKNKDTNRRIEGKGDVMDILIAGAKKIPADSFREDSKG